MRETKEFDPIHAAKHGYTREDWDEVSDNPEWTEEDFAKARPFREVFPDLYASIEREGVERDMMPGEVAIVRLDADLAARLKASGPGWEERAKEALRRWIDEAA